jgi:3-polyprenyl-4-hydroxybenzoate decarboxylase
MMWAVATRVQWRRDTLFKDGMSGSTLDPSWPPGADSISKMGIDATVPAATGSGASRPFAPRIAVPPAALQKARRLLGGVDDASWPLV